MTDSTDVRDAVAALRAEPHVERALTPTAERSLDAALALVATLGPDKVTMDDIAVKARISRMTLFRRFGSKENLMAAAFDREIRLLLVDLETRVGATATVVDRVDAIFDWMIDLAWTHPYVRRLAADDVAGLSDLWRSGDPSWAEIGCTLLSEYLQDPDLDDPLSAARASQVAELLERLGISYALAPSLSREAPDGALARRLARIASRALLDGR